MYIYIYTHISNLKASYGILPHMYTAHSTLSRSDNFPPSFDGLEELQPIICMYVCMYVCMCIYM